MTGFPATSQTVEVGGHALAYVDVRPAVETGPPVVLVHGNPTWSFFFRRFLDPLTAAGRRVLAPDHIGMGRSAKPSESAYPFSFGRRVADFGAFLDAVVPDGPISLVVHDWGGAIALTWAVDHVERLDRLVLLNTGAFPLPPGKALPWSLRAARVPVLGSFAVRRLNAFSLGALVLGTTQRVLPAEARAGLLAPYRRAADRVAVDRFVRDIPTGAGQPSYDRLTRTEQRLELLRDVPSAIFWGMKDPVFDSTVLDHLVGLLPHAEVHRFATAGHYVLEDAGDRVVPDATAFLTRR